VVAVSAGNDGPGAGTVGSPGSAQRALTAGASTVGHYVGVPIEGVAGRVAVAATGEFAVPEEDLTAPLGVVADGAGLGTACTALPADSLAGHTALISRGGCTFGTKVDAAQRAGAVAVVIVNSVPGDPIAMAVDPAYSTTIPAVMAPLGTRAELMALDGEDVTVGAEQAYLRSGNDNILASFSSWGPTDVSYAVKPDVVAPGVNVLSSFPSQYCGDGAPSCWAFLSGTSMAAPHLAGMAAVVRQAHPGWEAWMVRSAIINTADRDAVTETANPTSADTDVQHVGSGLADLEGSVTAQVALSSPSVSFGAVPSGSGALRSQTVSVTNLTGSELVLPAQVQDQGGEGDFAVTPSSLTLPAGGQADLRITFVAGKGAAKGPTQAILVLGDDALAHAALFAHLK
jgi:subtilisin family serine protease